MITDMPPVDFWNNINEALSNNQSKEIVRKKKEIVRRKCGRRLG